MVNINCYFCYMISTGDLYQVYLQHPTVQTDTRKLQPGDVFFALKGPNFNANAFAHDALNAGAAYVVADELTGAPHDRILLVEDVLSSLQELALHHRRTFDIPFIAITGSNGKTTTKELIHTVLSSKYITYTTEGNLNNHIGIPLTLLKIKKDAEIAVIEMGANHLKEIEAYCRYVLPTHGIITNCGKAHLEGFGSPEGVRKAKGELFDFLRGNNGTAFIFDDYDYLHEMSAGIEKIIPYGIHKGFVSGNIAHNKPYIAVQIKDGPMIETQLVGDYNLPNILCAAAVGKYFHIPQDVVAAAIAGYTPSNSRSQLVEQGTNKIIFDAYNANPSSMMAAIENMAGIESGRKVLVLGAMKEMGADSIAEHQQLVDQIAQYKWKHVALVGGDFAKTDHNFLYFPTPEEAGKWLRAQQLQDAYILIKGSRGIAMEKVFG